MIKKSLLVILSLSFITVFSLYLYSHFQSPPATPPLANNSTPPIQQNTSQAAASQTSDQALSAEAKNNETSQQPDKSLPIPAHQLKQLVNDQQLKPSTTLEEKILAVDERIQNIDQQLPSSNQAPVAQTVAENDASKNNNVQQRIDHIKQHLEEKSP